MQVVAALEVEEEGHCVLLGEDSDRSDVMSSSGGGRPAGETAAHGAGAGATGQTVVSMDCGETQWWCGFCLSVCASCCCCGCVCWCGEHLRGAD